MDTANSIKPTLTDSDIERFWSKVAVTRLDECWLWTARTDKDGYGSFCVYDHVRTKLIGKFRSNHFRAHVLARFLSTGEWPVGLCTLHNCPAGDNPSCCNPAHLWLGTVGQNNSDRARKGRNRDQRGENHSYAKLTSAQVLEIRALYATGKWTQKLLAQKFGVASVCDIVLRRNWKHI